MDRDQRSEGEPGTMTPCAKRWDKIVRYEQGLSEAWTAGLTTGTWAERQLNKGADLYFLRPRYGIS